MRAVFMGTPEFAVSSLKAIYDHGDEVVLVVSQPDKPKGRGYVMTPSEVKTFALEHGSEVITPKTLKDGEVIEKLKSVNADVFIVTAYGKILPQAVLDIPPMGCVNVHASLLPQWRGAAPINRAVMNGDEKGGVTLMYMDSGMDTGDIISRREVEIPFDCDAGRYHDMLATAGYELLTEFLDLCGRGEPIPREKQDSSAATYAQKITGEDCFIDFSRSGKEIYNRIRGLLPFPGPYFLLDGKRIKVKKAELSDGSGTPGEIISFEKGIEIACGEGSIIIKSLCPEGKSVTDAASFLRGHRLEKGKTVNG